MTDAVRRGCSAAAFLVGVAAAATLCGEEPPRRPPLPEQILTESITDLDAVEPGETEFALNAQTLAATTGGARARHAPATEPAIGVYLWKWSPRSARSVDHRTVPWG